MSGVVFRRIGGRIVPILKKAARDVKNVPKAFGYSRVKSEAGKAAMRTQQAAGDLSRAKQFSSDKRALGGKLHQKANEYARQAKDIISRPMSGNMFTQKQERVTKVKTALDLRKRRDISRATANRAMNSVTNAQPEILERTEILGRANKANRRAKRDLLQAKSGLSGLGIVGAGTGAVGVGAYSMKSKKRKK